MTDPPEEPNRIYAAGVNPAGVRVKYNTDPAEIIVIQRGLDSSGRPLFATDYMWAWWDQVCDALGFAPTIVQGAFMTRAGGGAAASAGYHDAGGCFDLRVWDIKDPLHVVRVLREHGAAAWLRDEEHGGMDPHIHFVLGTDRPLSAGARSQWAAYFAGRDGLASNGPDYHWRPSPLVLTPPEDDMPLTKDDIEKVAKRTVELLLSTDVDPGEPRLKVGQAIRQSANGPGLTRKLASLLGHKV